MPDDPNQNQPNPFSVVDSPPPSPTVEENTPVATENVETPPPPIVSEDGSAQQSGGYGIPPVVTAPIKPKGKGKKGMVAAILGILLLVGGLGAGIILVQRQQELREKAAGIESEYKDIAWDGICDDGDDPRDYSQPHGHGLGCSNRMGGNEYEIVHFLCDEVLEPGVGCGYDNARTYHSDYGTETFSEDCGTEQMDAANPYGSTGFASIWHLNDCGGGGPTNPPTSTPTPTPTLPPGPTWPPTLTPTPTATPCIGCSPKPTPTVTPVPLSCDSVCNPNNDLCPDPLECRLVGVGGGVFANVCRNPQCEYETDCTCGTPTPTPPPGQCPPGYNPYCNVNNLCLPGEPYIGPCPGGNGKLCCRLATPTPPPGGYFQCLNLKAYNTSWVLLSLADLAKLKAGDKVRFTVAGQTTYGEITKAMFSINNSCTPAVTTTKPGSNPLEFYYEYTIPAGTTSFNVDARLYVEGFGWMGGMEHIDLSCTQSPLPTPPSAID